MIYIYTLNFWTQTINNSIVCSFHLINIKIVLSTECEHNGDIYNNGERLDTPDEPCQVCYCKGGEVMCTSITCYQRDDCEPQLVPGQCCPKYDHCPLRGWSINYIQA